LEDIYIVITVIYSKGRINSIAIIRKEGDFVKKRQFACLVIVIALLIPMTIYGATATKKISVYLNSLKVFVSGEKVPNDVIVYNGKVYVNANDVSKALKQEYSWDKKNNNVYIGDKPVDLSAIKMFGTGTYIVNKDLQPGLYKVLSLSNSGYIARASAVDMDSESILANDIFQGDGYFEILNTDVAVKLSNVKIYKIDLTKYEKKIKNTASNGIFLVGYDLTPGRYKVELNIGSSSGYMARLSAVTLNMSDTIANDIVQGPSYLDILETDFAVKLSGVKITKEN